MQVDKMWDSSEDSPTAGENANLFKCVGKPFG